MKNTREWFIKNKNTFNKNIQNICVNCGKTSDLYLHHIVPLSNGGTNNESNIVKLCGTCHARVHSTKNTSIREMTKRALQIKKERGEKLGRPVVEYPDNWNKVYKQWKDQKITGVQAMQLMDLKKTTFYKLVKQYENK